MNLTAEMGKTAYLWQTHQDSLKPDDTWKKRAAWVVDKGLRALLCENTQKSEESVENPMGKWAQARGDNARKQWPRPIAHSLRAVQGSPSPVPFCPVQVVPPAGRMHL